MAEPPPSYSAASSPYVPSAPKDFNGGAPGPPGAVPMPPCQFPAGNAFPVGPQQFAGPQFIRQPGQGAFIAPTTTVIVGNQFHQDPQQFVCPHCQANIITNTKPKSGLLTWIICGAMTIFGCWLCCCIPFCVSACQDVEHFCPSCKRYFGTYRRI